MMADEFCIEQIFIAAINKTYQDAARQAKERGDVKELNRLCRDHTELMDSPETRRYLGDRYCTQEREIMARIVEAQTT